MIAKKGSSRLPLHTVVLLALTLFLLTCLVGCGKEAKQINTLADLQGMTIAAETGSVHASAVKSHPLLSDCDILYGYSNADCIAYLMSHKADGIALDYLMAQTILHQFDGLAQLEDTLSPAEYGFAFQKGNMLCNEFSHVLAEMKSDGRLDAIVQKWAENNDSLAPQIWSGESGTLHCQIDPSVEPMCYVAEDGSYRGLDVDIILEIAKELNYRIEFVENDFDDLIPSLLAGQADFIASGITITDTRQKTVDFCDGYLDASTIIIVLDSSAPRSLSSRFLSIRNSFRRTFLEENRWFELLKGLGTTLWIAAVTIVFGLLIGAAMYLWKYSESKLAARLIPKIVRLSALMPLSTWLLICYYLVFPAQSGHGYAAGVFALSITYAIASYCSISDNMDSISQGQLDAATCIGYTRWECLRYVMFPRAVEGIVASLDTQTVYHIRDTSLLSFVAVMDVQAVADGIGAQTAEPFLPIILIASIYILLNLSISSLLRRLRKKVAAIIAGDEKWDKLKKEVNGHDPS